MARPVKKLVRKKDLVRATMMAIHGTGLAEPTMAQISTCAGLASGSIISHYFASKEELLEQTYRELATVFMGEVVFRVRAARTPIEKVEAVVAAVFAPSQTTPEAVSAWLWFWSRAAINSTYGQIERTTYASVRDELEAALRGLLPKANVADVAEGMLALMYGLWLRFALDPGAVDVARAVRITMDLVRIRLAAQVPSTSASIGRSAKPVALRASRRQAA